MALRTFDDGGTAAINWIYHSYNRARPFIQPGLDKDTRHPEWTSRLLEVLGRPDAQMYNIAVTGSKGKGSHAILIAAMLQRMGFRTGLFTGPHLVDFMERFRINGEMIAESSFVHYVGELRQIVADWSLPDSQYFGPVGLLAVIAAKWFYEKETDLNIFELGRGALHDDVNRIHHTGAVLSPIFLEHTAQLGNTFAQIGTEKCGVITDDTKWVVSHPQTATVQSILQTTCGPNRHLFTLGDDIRVTEKNRLGKTCRVSVETPLGACDVLLPDAEYHLADNVAAALMAAQQAALDRRPGCVLPNEIDLRDLSLPGRLQTVAHHPEVVVDGTIHGRSAVIVRDFILGRQGQALDSGTPGTQGTPLPGQTEPGESSEDHPRVGAIMGIPADKDGVGVMKTLADVLDFIVICRAHNPHLTFDDTWAKLAEQLFREAHVVEYLEEALGIARDRLRSEDTLLILGTQSLVGDAMTAFDVDTRSIWRTPSPVQSAVW